MEGCFLMKKINKSALDILYSFDLDEYYVIFQKGISSEIDIMSIEMKNQIVSNDYNLFGKLFNFSLRKSINKKEFTNFLFHIYEMTPPSNNKESYDFFNNFSMLFNGFYEYCPYNLDEMTERLSQEHIDNLQGHFFIYMECEQSLTYYYNYILTRLKITTRKHTIEEEDLAGICLGVIPDEVLFDRLHQLDVLLSKSGYEYCENETIYLTNMNEFEQEHDDYYYLEKNTFNNFNVKKWN